MDPTASFSGLASGVQWRDLIDQMMRVERRPAHIMETRVTTIQTRSAAWLDFQNRLTSFRDAASTLSKGTPFRAFTTAIAGGGFSASAGEAAEPGSYSVDVLRLAAAEKVGGDAFASATAARGLDGELWVNGSRVAVRATDSLNDIAYAINAANTGASATRVSAAVVDAGSDSRLVLTSQRTGAAGIDLVDGAGGVLRGLGLLDGSTALKHGTSSGARSDGFASATATIASQRGLTGTATGTATIGAGTLNEFAVTLDLGQGLDDIAAAINTAAAAAGKAVTAAVVTDTVDGATVHRLDISGTTSFADQNGVLETLGVLRGGRGAVAQVVQSGTTLEVGATGTAATGLTALTDLGALGAAAGVAPGDTLTVNGTRPDGSAFTLKLEVTNGVDPATRDGHVGVGSIDDLLTALNGAGGFDGAAAAAIVNGRIVVEDASGGPSQLGLSIVAHNEGGGALDFGAFDTTALGRARQIVAGQDAEIRVDGAYSTHRTNSVAGVVAGVSMTLSAVTSGATLTVSRDDDAAMKSVKGWVEEYNKIAAFVSGQFAGGEGARKPLAGDATLRGMRTRIVDAMRQTLAAGAAGSWTRMGDLGIEIQKDGTFKVDDARLRDALTSDPRAVERLFGVHGATSGGGLTYIAAGDATRSGTYAIAISSHATTAAATGTGSLVDPYAGADDTLRITDLGSGRTYAVALTAGLTGQALVDAVNAELGTPTAQTLASAAALHADGLGTAVGADTVWAQVHGEDRTTAGVADGDTITISGRRADGTAIYETFTITNASTQTVGELRDRIAAAVGAGATVELAADGRFRVTATDTGASLLQVAVSSDNAGGGTLQLGLDVETQGRSTAPITASLSGGSLRLVHESYGSSAGFRVDHDTADAEGWLGLGAAAEGGVEVRGTDVVGTIGGHATTGAGRLLTGAADTAVHGLALRVEDTFTTGSVTFSRGIASLVERAVAPMLSKEGGSIHSITEGLGEQVSGLNDRIEAFDDRLVRRREDLIRRFTAMEQAMSLAQSQSAWLSSQVNHFSSYSGRNR
jgi:flagellar hook-associated protein 2